MSVDIEMIGIGITAVAPIYGGLWYLVSTAVQNKTNISNIQIDVSELKDKLKSCRNCAKGVTSH